MLLDRAQEAGAQIEKTRVLDMERAGTRWSLRTKTGAMEVDYCIVATGARNPLRDFGTELKSADTMSALGYYVAGERDDIDIQFLPRALEGYIWVFPRCGHLSVGICGKGEPASALRARLETYMEERGLSKKGAAFYSHLLPSLETPAWKRNRVAGDGWLAVGDAAGLVDPITGEGLYYAMRSADLATTAILSDTAEAGSGLPQIDSPRFHGRSRIRFAPGKAACSTGRSCGGAVTSRMVQFTRLSPKFRDVMQDLFAGTQPYIGLKHRLMSNLKTEAWSRFSLF